MEGINFIDLAVSPTNVHRKLQSDNFKTSLANIKEADNELDDTEQGLARTRPKRTAKSTAKPTAKPTATVVSASNLVKSRIPKLKGLSTTIKVKETGLGKPALSNTEKFPLLSKIKKENLDDEEVNEDDEPVPLGTVHNTAAECAPEPDTKPFDIMDYVLVVKVSGVGTLYQCELCNRNFMNKEVLLSHECTRQKVDLKNRSVQPQGPKVPAVEYMNTTENKTQPNNSIPEEETKKPVKLYRPGPKSRVGPRPENDEQVTQMINCTVVNNEAPSSSKETKKRPKMDSTFETPPKIVKVHPHVSEATSSSTSKPYPVGLFQTMPHHSRATFNPAPLYVSEAKRQSCRVIPTDKPGKLLITTNPHITFETPIPGDTNAEPQGKSSTVQPFTSPTRPEQYFTIINVDPVSQPSYVLPTGE